MHPIPPTLLGRPFHRSEALALGVSSRVLEGPRFERLHPRVYRHRDQAMTFEDAVAAARLALPDDVRPTGSTRLRLLGLGVGPVLPLRFVVARDLHLALPGIFLHRTVLLPPTDGDGVCPAAAFVAFCHRTRVIDAIGAGDWLLHHEHMSGDELATLIAAQDWRDGAAEAAWLQEHLSGDPASLLESEARSLVVFAGLPHLSRTHRSAWVRRPCAATSGSRRIAPRSRSRVHSTREIGVSTSRTSTATRCTGATVSTTRR